MLAGLGSKEAGQARSALDSYEVLRSANFSNECDRRAEQCYRAEEECVERAGRIVNS